MRDNSLLVFSLLGVIIGASGLGFGIFSMIQIQSGVVNGEDGEDGDDGATGKDGTDWQAPPNIHYCSSQSDIEDALDSIGLGHGTIIITENITLNSQIDINGGGNYIIQGAGQIKINQNAHDESFYVTNAQSLTLKDLIIDTTNTTFFMPGIYVNEVNNNPVYIQNVQIGGGNIGLGISVKSENVWIENCIITALQCGIYLSSGSGHCHIINNKVHDMYHSSIVYGILLENSDFHIISGNSFDNLLCPSTVTGIRIANSKYFIINNNVITNINAGTGQSNAFYINNVYTYTISGNIIYNINSISSAVSGIYFYNYCENATITGNLIRDILSGGLRNGMNGLANNHTIVGNNCINCGANPINVMGSGNIIEGNNPP